MRRAQTALQLLFVGWTLAHAGSASAYDLAAHAAISGRAVGGVRSTVDTVLKALGFPSGVATDFTDGTEGKTAREWIQEGAKLEDNPETRVVNHFHDPLASTWDRAGLRVFGFPLGKSSVLWQQNREQASTGGAGGGSWSWQNARDRYFEALTQREQADREAAFAKLFRGLGQVTHLVQDASLPAHSRNDAHFYRTVFGIDLGNPDGYERWVDRLREGDLATLLSRPAVLPAGDIFRRHSALPSSSRTDHPAAPAPVKRLIDTGRYVGSNPEVLVGDLIGLAEYSNGNFFSDDTIFAERPAVFGTIPFPARTSVELGPPEPSPRGGGRLRRYFVKARHGETQTADSLGAMRNYRLAVPSALYEYLPDALQDQTAGLDPKVLEDYATLLLPRAVGYSAALLDHFFRGELRVRPVGASQGASSLQPVVRVTNRTEGERLDGTLYLYYDTVEGKRERLDGWQPEISLATDGESDLPPIPAPSSDKPAARPGRYLLVFKGRMGEEPDAVIARWVDVWVGYFGTLSQSTSCSRLPSNQLSCRTSRASTGPRIVIPDEHGAVVFGGEAAASESQFLTVTPPVFGTDNPAYFYFGDSGFSQTLFYLFREGGGATMKVSAGAPGCFMLGGTLAGGAASLAMGMPPEFETYLNFEGPFEGAESTIAVTPGSLLFMFFPPAALADPLTGPGTSSKSTSCSIVGIQFPVE